MQKMKKALSAAITISMVLGTVPNAFAASNDINGHWAQTAITSWENKNLISGYEDGSFRPNQAVTRAEFVTLMNKSLGLTEKGEVSFSDVSTSDWFYNDVAIAIKEGYCSGFPDGGFHPNEAVTRAQAASFVSNYKKLASNTEKASEFSDYTALPSWAAGAIGAMAEAGYMSGYPDGSFNGNKTLTRAEAVVTLDKVMNGAEVEKPSEKDVVIDKADTVLEDQTVEGNLVISEKVGDGDVTLKNVTVKGDLLVQGGGSKSIHMVDGSVAGKVVLDKKSVNFVVEGEAKIDTIELKQIGSINQNNFYGNIGEVIISAETGTTNAIVLNVLTEKLTISEKAFVRIQSNIENVVIEKDAAGAKVDVASGARVSNMEVNAKAILSGGGNITTLEVNANGVTKSTSLSVRETNTASGVDKPTTSTTTGGGGGGGSSSSKSKKPVTSVKIEGEARIGQTLKAIVNSDADSVSYKWLSCDTVDGEYAEIAEATSVSYVIPSAMKTKFIKVMANGVKGSSVTSDATAAVANPSNEDMQAELDKIDVSSIKVTVAKSSAKADVEAAITAEAQKFVSDLYTASFSADAAIETGTAGEVVVAGKFKVEMVGDSGVSKVDGTSRDVAVTVDSRTVLEGTLTVSGDLKVGSKLTVDGITSSEPGKLTYQWTGAGEAAEGTYTVAEGDIGKTVQVEVSAENYFGSLTGESGKILNNKATVTSEILAVSETEIKGTADMHIITGVTTVSDFMGALIPADGIKGKLLAAADATDITTANFASKNAKEDGEIAEGDVLAILSEDGDQLGKYTVISQAEVAITAKASTVEGRTGSTTITLNEVIDGLTDADIAVNFDDEEVLTKDTDYTLGELTGKEIVITFTENANLVGNAAKQLKVTITKANFVINEGIAIEVATNVEASSETLPTSDIFTVTDGKIGSGSTPITAETTRTDLKGGLTAADFSEMKYFAAANVETALGNFETAEDTVDTAPVAAGDAIVVKAEDGTVKAYYISIDTVVTATADALTSATGKVTITLDQEIKGLVKEDVVVTIGGASSNAFDFAVNETDAKKIEITFTADAKITKESVITIKVVKDGYYMADAASVTLELPSVELGAQSAKVETGTGGTATFAITQENSESKPEVAMDTATEGITASITGDSKPYSVSIEVTSAVAAGSYTFKVTADGAEATGTLVVDEAAPKASVSLGAQTGEIKAEAGGTATFAITQENSESKPEVAMDTATEGITASITGDSKPYSVSIEVTSAVAAGSYTFKVTADGAEATGTLVVDAADPIA